MALGRGLQSLIPPQGNDANNASDFVSDEKKYISESDSDRIREVEHRPHDNVSEYKPVIQSRKDDAVFLIEIEKIQPNPYQPRKDFDEDELRELAQSIQEFGVIQPIIVSKTVKATEQGTDVEYQLIAGERRLKASKIAGLERIPAIVRQADSSKIKLELALIENLQRSDLNAIESAKAYSRLQDEFGLTQREVASRVGKSRETISNTMRLLNLPSDIQRALSENKINESQARVLLSIQDPSAQRDAFRRLTSEKLSVRELRDSTPSHHQEDSAQRFWEKKLEERLQSPVKIKRNGEKGKIIIPFYPKSEMQALIDR
ncbi:MAG: ParB/RepB/Spo0J family partition protein, partial [Oscillospiraceae bacterium]